jgi:SHS2 domain-containing protein
MKAYTYRGDISYADIAFEAVGATLEELFQNAGDALAEVIINNLDQVKNVETRIVRYQSEAESLALAAEDLLYELLQAMIYWKDVDLLILRVKTIYFNHVIPEKKFQFTAELSGEKIDSKRHQLGSDVKAVTYHRLKVFKDDSIWKANVLLDI